MKLTCRRRSNDAIDPNRTFASLAQRLRAPRIKVRNHERQRGRESNRNNQAGAIVVLLFQPSRESKA